MDDFSKDRKIAGLPRANNDQVSGRNHAETDKACRTWNLGLPLPPVACRTEELVVELVYASWLLSAV